MMKHQRLQFGVMVSSLKEDADTGQLLTGEPKLYTQLAAAASSLSIDLYLFQPSDYDLKQTLTGYRCIHNSWQKQIVPLPDIIYDRSFASSTSRALFNRYMMSVMKSQKSLIRLNEALPSKWTVYKHLKQNRSLSPYLPHTEQLFSMKQMLDLLHRYSEGIVIKPAAGMQGKGIISIKQQKNDNSYQIKGRTKGNQPFIQNSITLAALSQKLHMIIRSKRYIIQPLLSLSDEQKRPFDIRVLLQKDGQGIWQVTGTAIRCGAPDGLTSNLHGGGTAYKIDQFLTKQLSMADLEQLKNNLSSTSKLAALWLEQRLGKFGELAFDFGLDHKQHLWLLEVNSKPGRSCFHAIEDHNAQVQSIFQPLRYAKFLYANNCPVHIHRVAKKGRNQPLFNRLRSLNIQEVHQ